jgi:hypothetical protein
VTADAKNGEIVIKGPNIMQATTTVRTKRKVLMADGSFAPATWACRDEATLHHGPHQGTAQARSGKYVVPPCSKKSSSSPFIANVMIGANKPSTWRWSPDLTRSKWAAETGMAAGRRRGAEADRKGACRAQHELHGLRSRS